jgi:hypothetical protein
MIDTERDATPPAEPYTRPPSGESPSSPTQSPPARRRQRRWLMGLGAVVGIVAVLHFATGHSSQDTAVDTTGASSATAQPSSSAAPATPGGAAPNHPRAQHTLITIDGRAVNGDGPILLLSPGLVRPGAHAAATGFGFDPGTSVDLVLKSRESDRGSTVGVARTDENGSFGGASVSIPDALENQTLLLVAQERNGSKTAETQAAVAAGTGSVELAKTVGKPGDVVSVSAHGFSPGEAIDVHWGRLGGDPVAKLQSDSSGGVGRTSLKVPIGAVGDNTLLLVGERSQTVATASFFMLSLYPTLDLGSYAVKGAQPVSFSGKGFGPDEEVAIYLNGSDGQPIETAKADDSGGFTDPGFKAPFGLKGHQNLIAVGQESRAAVGAGFDLLPYTPSAQPSTYGGRPGTAVSFYATDFAPGELVHVYLGRNQSGPGDLVSCFAVDARGGAGAAGSYTIPGDAQTGKLQFALVGKESEATATATLSVMPSDVPVQVAPQPKFTCPLDAQAPSSTTPASPSPTPSTSARASALASPSAAPATASPKASTSAPAAAILGYVVATQKGAGPGSGGGLPGPWGLWTAVLAVAVAGTVTYGWSRRRNLAAGAHQGTDEP